MEKDRAKAIKEVPATPPRRRSVLPPVEENSASPTEKDGEQMNSSQLASLLPTPPTDFIVVTVKSIMSGMNDTRIQVASQSYVRDLRNVIYEQCDVVPERQMLLFGDQELKNDDVTLASVGMKGNCSVTMNVKMSSGLPLRRTTGSSVSKMVFFVPALFPQRSDTQLRMHLKEMRTLKKNKKMEQVKVPDEKEIKELEETRNRMKNLVHKRSKTNKLLPPKAVRSTSSITNSIGKDNTSSRSPCPSPSPLPSPVANDEPMTEKELKVFFETVENLRQMKEVDEKQYMLPPPQNTVEHAKLKEELEEIEKAHCRECRQKLSATEQTMTCRCKKFFCGKHRDPVMHMCVIDYRHTSRTKLAKENVKVSAKKAIE